MNSGEFLRCSKVTHGIPALFPLCVVVERPGQGVKCDLGRMYLQDLNLVLRQVGSLCISLSSSAEQHLPPRILEHSQ